jgi:allantoin racemase
MSTRILWINPVKTDAYDKAIGDALRAEARGDTRIDVASLTGVGPNHLEFNALEMMVAAPTVGVVRWAEENGYDAAIIGCFYDPCLRAAREVSQSMPVTAPAEACLHIANTLGERVSVLVGRDKWIPEMHENVVKYGFADRLASFRALGMTVNQFQLDPKVTEARILEEARLAVEQDGADVIVLGCTIEFGFYQALQAELGVPVVDAIVGPLRYAELLSDLKGKQGWSHSKRLGYGGPSDTELSEWIPVVTPNVTIDPRTLS